MKSDIDDPINVLLISQTGGGKSTFVNAAKTALKHKSFESAKKAPLENCVPTHFTYIVDDGKNFKTHNIRIGNDDNENCVDGEAHTQEPKTHVFEFGNRRINLIDTPGICDPRGIDCDKRNLTQIIEYIKPYRNIHLVVFLLTPDFSRVTDAFSYFFKELIMQFHRKCVDNIVFAVRGTGLNGYQPDDTFTPLKVLLDDIKVKQGVEIPMTKETMFTYENIFYRYLCMQSSGLPKPYTNNQRKLIAENYQHSRDEYLRLFKRAATIEPHDLRHTASLNYTRGLVLKLAPPLAKITENIRMTCEMVKEREEDMKKCKTAEEELELRRFRPITMVKYCLELRTSVKCKNCATLEVYKGNERLPFIEADPGIANVDPLEVWRGDEIEPNAKGEYACPTHGANFEKLKTGKTFWTIHEERMVEDETTANKIKDKKTLHQELADLRANDMRLALEVDEERKTIIKASAKCAAFMITSSIIPYNDSAGDYFKVLMQLEESKHGKSSAKYISLEEMKRAYDEEKRIIENSVQENNEENQITVDDIYGLIETLKSLKHFGKDIQNVITDIAGEEIPVELLKKENVVLEETPATPPQSPKFWKSPVKFLKSIF